MTQTRKTALNALTAAFGTAVGAAKGEPTKKAAKAAEVEARRTVRRENALRDLAAGKHLGRGSKNARMSARATVETVAVALRAGALVEDVLVTGAGARFAFAVARTALAAYAAASKVDPADLLVALGLTPDETAAVAEELLLTAEDEAATLAMGDEAAMAEAVAADEAEVEAEAALVVEAPKRKRGGGKRKG